jgi:DNA-binding CsgD family transcriptional regulator
MKRRQHAMPVPHAISVIDAAWRLDVPEEPWLQAIVEAAAPALDVGFGIHGMVLDLTSPEGPVRTPVMVGGTDDWQARWREDWWAGVVRDYPAAAHLAATAAGPVAYASDTNRRFLSSMSVWVEYAKALVEQGAATPAMQVHFGPEAAQRASKLYPETLYVGGLDRPGHAVVLCVNLASTRARQPPRAMVRTWARAASHLGAALRLRKALGATKAPPAPEAVVAPGGRLLHAEGEATSKPAREALRLAAIHMDRARSNRRDVSEFERLEAWKALRAGRWSLLDSFERDGRRFLVARPNAPRPKATGQLTLRERQVLDFLAVGHANKLIAYELGISASSVATHLKRAATKLGASSTNELIAMARRGG